MSSALDLQLEGSSVTFEQLFEIQEAFDDTEVEIIRHQAKLNKPIYEKRAKVVAGIPNFWPLVFEQAPPDVDEYIQPTDAALLMASLKTIHVSHFEIEGDGADFENGDPRSVSIKFEFGENDHFEDRVVEKKFWYRRAKGGSWSGLVSEPVNLKWKEGKDLTQGLLAAVKKVWDEEQKSGATSSDEKELTPAQKELQKKIESSGGSGGVSFFAWFGYRGKNVSAEESRLQTEKEKEHRRLKAEGKEVPDEDEDEENDDEDDDDEGPLEVFPGGDQLAVCIVEDLWQDAIKYFLAAQEQGDDSDIDYESDEDEDMEGSSTLTADQPPVKKQKN